MSWSISSEGKAEEVLTAVLENQQLPSPIKDYMHDGIDALTKRHGDDVTVTLSGSGHLHNGEEGNWDSTTANINISRKTQ